MLKIIIPANNIKERTYLLDIVFKQFFRVPYNMVISNKITDEYQIWLDNKKNIVIKDHFFSLYPNDLEYLKEDAIPKKVNYVSNKLFKEKDIPVLFGGKSIKIRANHIVCSIDIFATIFFMLTRWEEYVVVDKDKHGRFSHTACLAYKHNFLHRPIVDEYIEFLWNMLLCLGYKESRYKDKFSILITHDVDHTLRYLNFKMLLVRLAGDIVIRKSLFRPFKTIFEYIAVLKKRKKDPYDTFDEIMDISDSFNLKAYFFFMSGGTAKGYDNTYSIDTSSTKKIIDNIYKRGHRIGIHSSYNAYNNIEQFGLEKNILDSVVSSPVISGRGHYLRFEVPTTWQIWEDNGISWCSNMAYANASGFRAGICRPYTPFNILTRKKLFLKERPLIMMEGTFILESNNPLEMEESIEYYLKTVRKYNGEFVLLWHNSNFSSDYMKPYKYIYIKIIRKQQLLQN